MLYFDDAIVKIWRHDDNRKIFLTFSEISKGNDSVTLILAFGDKWNPYFPYFHTESR